MAMRTAVATGCASTGLSFSLRKASTASDLLRLPQLSGPDGA